MVDAKLIYTPHAVDNAYFSEQYELLRKDVPSVKKALNIPLDKTIILFSGKYIEQKRPLDLIQAFNQLKDPSVVLIMVGEGNLRTEMETFINEHNVCNVILTGFINQSAISQYYIIADIFIMCSGSETWGLVVNEAMNFAKPIIVSDTCGCSADLVLHGKNGFVFQEGDIDALSKFMSQLIEDSSFRVQAGEISKRIIADFSINNIVENLKMVN